MIATVLIIGFTIVLAALVINFGGSLFKRTVSESSDKGAVATLCSSMDFSIKSSRDSKNSSIVNVVVKNNNANNIIGFLFKVSNDKESKLFLGSLDNLIQPSINTRVFSSISGDFSVGSFVVKNFGLKPVEDSYSKIEVLPIVLVNNKKEICSSSFSSDILGTSSVVYPPQSIDSDCNQILPLTIEAVDRDDPSVSKYRDYIYGSGGEFGKIKPVYEGVKVTNNGKNPIYGVEFTLSSPSISKMVCWDSRLKSEEILSGSNHSNWINYFSSRWARNSKISLAPHDPDPTNNIKILPGESKTFAILYSIEERKPDGKIISPAVEIPKNTFTTLSFRPLIKKDVVNNYPTCDFLIRRNNPAFTLGSYKLCTDLEIIIPSK